METTFTVSNTDVITMLMVEQREILKNQREVTYEKYRKEINKQVDEVTNKVISLIKKNKNINEGLDALNVLFKVLNPKIKFTLEYEHDIKRYIENQIYMTYHETYGLNKGDIIEFDVINIKIDLENEDEDEGRFIFPWGNGYEEISLPFKHKYKYKLDENIKKLSSELTRIDELTRNENTLKEKLIASVTKNAIKDLPEMKALIGGVNLLEN